MQTVQGPVDNYVSSAITSLKENFVQEYLKQPSAQDIATWYLEIVDKKWDVVCERCTTMSFPCSSMAFTVVSCARCINDGAGRYCSRSKKEKESRVKRVLNLDSDAFESLFRSSFSAQATMSWADFLSINAFRLNMPVLQQVGSATPSNIIRAASMPSTSPVQQSLPFAWLGRGQSTLPSSAIVPEPSHSPINETESNGIDLRASSEKARNPPTFKVQLHQVQQLQAKFEELKAQLEDARANSNDAESKLQDEIAHTTELNQLLEANRRETGDLRRSQGRLEEKVKAREEERSKREAKMTELEAKVKKGEHDLHTAKREYEERLQEAGRAKDELEARMEDLRKTMADSGKKLEEDYMAAVSIHQSGVECWSIERKRLEETIREQQKALKTLEQLNEVVEREREKSKKQYQDEIARMKQSADERSLAFEKQAEENAKKEKTLRQRHEIERAEVKKNLEDEVSRLKLEMERMKETHRPQVDGVTEKAKVSGQHGEVQKTYRDTIIQITKSMDELKREIEQARLSQGEWQEKAEARSLELQQVRRVLDAQTRDLNKLEASLVAERRERRKSVDELQRKSREREKQPILDLGNIHNNLERLIQQFHTLRTAFADQEVSIQVVLDTCDHLGWQLVAIADSIADGLQDEDNEGGLDMNAIPSSMNPVTPSKSNSATKTTPSSRKTAPLMSSSPTGVQSEPKPPSSTSPHIPSKTPHMTRTPPFQSPAPERQTSPTVMQTNPSSWPTPSIPPPSVHKTSKAHPTQSPGLLPKTTPVTSSNPTLVQSEDTPRRAASKVISQVAPKSSSEAPPTITSSSHSPRVSTSTAQGPPRIPPSVIPGTSPSEAASATTANASSSRLLPATDNPSASTSDPVPRARSRQNIAPSTPPNGSPVRRPIARKSTGRRPPLPSGSSASETKKRASRQDDLSDYESDTKSLSEDEEEERVPLIVPSKRPKGTARKSLGGPPLPTARGFYGPSKSRLRRTRIPPTSESEREVSMARDSTSSDVVSTSAFTSVGQKPKIQTARKLSSGHPRLMLPAEPASPSAQRNQPSGSKEKDRIEQRSSVLTSTSSVTAEGGSASGQSQRRSVQTARKSVGIRRPPFLGETRPEGLAVGEESEELRTGPRPERVKTPRRAGKSGFFPASEGSMIRKRLLSDEEVELRTWPRKRQRF